MGLFDIFSKTKHKQTITYNNGDQYYGDTVDGKKQGTGTYTWANGDKYEGEYLNGKCHGYGKKTYVDGRVEEGKWHYNNFVEELTGNNLFHETYDSGVTYVGEKTNGKRNGKGRMVWPDGDLYQGDFVDNYREGKGMYIWPNGECYKGDWHRGDQTGKGIYTYHNGSIYEGDWKDDKRTGKGKYTWPNGSIYEGDWKDDKRTGKGKYTWANGDMYEGDYVDGKRTGKGKFTWANGDIYEGDFVDGCKHGCGKMTYASGKVVEGIWRNDCIDEAVRDEVNYTNTTNKTDYIKKETITYNNGVYYGEVVNGVPNGKGKITWADGDMYEGDFVDGEQTGKGKYTWTDGDMYEGDFVDGEQTGKGKYTWADGDIYEGDYVDNKFNGKGKYIWANGNIYEGDWKDDKRTGKGKYIWVDGDIYEGDYVDNKITGKGKYTWSNGDMYEGGWLNNKREGYGKLTDTTGLVYEGYWHDDHRNGYGKTIYANKDTYEGEYENDYRSGLGKYVFTSGEVYIGNWSKNKRNGNGINTYVDEPTKEGFWTDDKLVIPGRVYIDDNDIAKIKKNASNNAKKKYTNVDNNITKKNVNDNNNVVNRSSDREERGDKLYFKSGAVYEGNIVNGQRQGYGKMTFTSGNVYEGEWKDDVRSGKGKFTEYNGTVYEGEFVLGKPEGYGIKTYASGRVVEGIWRNGYIDEVVRDDFNYTKTTNVTVKNIKKENIKYANGIYYGEVVHGVPHGKGKYTSANGDMYEGDFVDGKRTGKGKFIWATGDIYEGDYVDGKRTGKGKYTWATGDIYEGDYVDDKRTGKGKITMADGDMYEGDFIDGRITGKGKYTWADGDIYEGDFVDGKRTGKGKYTWADGDIYEGDFVDGERTGKGKYTWANGDMYEGDFVDGKFNGQGKKIFLDGRVLEGRWKNDWFHDSYGDSLKVKSTGKKIFYNGDIYEGEFKAGVIHGKGILKYANGDKYEGEFKDGVIHGKGTLMYANGDKYEGQFFQGVIDGEGKKTYVDGRVEEGLWQAGKFYEIQDDAPAIDSDILETRIRNLEYQVSKFKYVINEDEQKEIKKLEAAVQEANATLKNARKDNVSTDEIGRLKKISKSAKANLKSYRQNLEYTRRQEAINNLALLKIVNASAGDTITFGEYIKDDTGLKKEPIEWNVLERKDNKILVISKNAIECEVYDFYEDDKVYTWKVSKIRKWLNGKFLQKAFNTHEIEEIAETIVTEEKQYYESYGAKRDLNTNYKTIDKVFLLSLAELNTYFPTQESKVCTATKYAIRQSVPNAKAYAYGRGYVEIDADWIGHCRWGLRSTYWENNLCVNKDGEVTDSSVNKAMAVRPAFWIDVYKDITFARMVDEVPEDFKLEVVEVEQEEEVEEVKPYVMSYDTRDLTEAELSQIKNLQQQIATGNYEYNIYEQEDIDRFHANIQEIEESLSKATNEEEIDKLRERLESEKAYVEYYLNNLNVTKKPEAEDQIQYLQLGNAKVGDTILFGKYKQKDNTESPIEWNVLERKGNQILVISKYALDYKECHTNQFIKEVAWKNSTIRRWINETFMSAAFTSYQIEKIVVTDISDEDTQDKLFLLSDAEVERYYPSKESRQCNVTEYAKLYSPYAIKEGEYCRWGLRTMSFIGRHQTIEIVKEDGSLGDTFTYNLFAVRPALWIQLNEDGSDMFESKK